ncbi:hypothetical protein [Helicobacter sp. 11S02629-2]|uniref:hypothetical protein n=1 Tax=Helicobacter sp. 11S02629-2 TaxID=1476195 RepID=UPI000BA67951|nr:hypothetical protein [Helicobacter sp. 11S02629-2]PAF45684.1 hypothetical protein BKH40_02045 [Helicobacter sp. 11S02629-2]
MTRIITQADASTLQAVKDMLLKVDPDATFESYDETNYLSKEDQKNLKELLEADDRGEIEYISLEECEAEIDAYLKSKTLGA